jgi:hypothetical protein
MSQPIQPETITVKGVLVDGGIVCPLLKLATGELVPLMGIGMTDYPFGTRLEIKGTLIQHSPCQQGSQTLRIDRVLAVDGVAKE